MEFSKLLPELKIKKDEEVVLSGMFSKILEESERWELLSKVEVKGVDDENSMKIARQNRLDIRKHRLELEKFVASKRADEKEAIAKAKRVDDVLRKVGQHFSDKAKEYEEGLLQAEKYAETVEAQRIEALREKREEELRDLCEDPSMFLLGGMSETAYQALKKGLETTKAEEEKSAKEAKEKAEKEAVAKALYSERLKELAPYGDHFEKLKVNEKLTEETAEDVFIALKEELVSAKKVSDEIAFEADKVAKADKLAKETAEEATRRTNLLMNTAHVRLEAGHVIFSYTSSGKQLKKEIGYFTDANPALFKERFDQLVTVSKKESALIEAAAKKAASESDSEKVLSWVNSFSLPEAPAVMPGAIKEIKAEFDAFVNKVKLMECLHTMK